MCTPPSPSTIFRNATGQNGARGLGQALLDPGNLSGKFGAKPPPIPGQPDPAAAQAQAEASATAEANGKLAAMTRARKANVLALGGSDDSLGGGPLGALPTTAANVLGSGASTINAGSLGGGSVLAGGAGSGTSAGGGRSSGGTVKAIPL